MAKVAMIIDEPKNCAECQFCRYNGGNGSQSCCVKGGAFKDYIAPHDKRDPSCPLMPVVFESIASMSGTCPYMAEMQRKALAEIDGRLFEFPFKIGDEYKTRGCNCGLPGHDGRYFVSRVEEIHITAKGIWVGVYHELFDKVNWYSVADVIKSFTAEKGRELNEQS